MKTFFLVRVSRKLFSAKVISIHFNLAIFSNSSKFFRSRLLLIPSTVIITYTVGLLDKLEIFHMHKFQLQFFVLTAYFLSLVVSCRLPPAQAAYNLYVVLQGVIFTVLFLNFYFKSYTKPAKKVSGPPNSSSANIQRVRNRTVGFWYCTLNWRLEKLSENLNDNLRVPQMKRTKSTHTVFRYFDLEVWDCTL